MGNYKNPIMVYYDYDNYGFSVTVVNLEKSSELSSYHSDEGRPAIWTHQDQHRAGAVKTAFEMMGEFKGHAVERDYLLRHPAIPGETVYWKCRDCSQKNERDYKPRIKNLFCRRCNRAYTWSEIIYD